MASGGSVELEVLLNLQKLRKDAEEARRVIEGILKDIPYPLPGQGGSGSGGRSPSSRPPRSSPSGGGRSGEGGVADATKQIEDLEAAVKRAQASLSDPASSGELSRQAQLFQENLRFKRQLAAIENAGFSPEDAANAKKLATELNNLNVERVNREFDELEKTSRRVGSSFSALDSVFQGVGQRIGQELVQVLGNAVRGVSNAVAGGVREFADYDQALAVLAGRAQTSRDELGSLEGSLREIVTTTSQTPASVANAAVQIQALGASLEELPDLVAVAARGSDALGVDVVKLGEILKASTNTFSAFGLTAQESADQIAFLQANSAALAQGGLTEIQQLLQQSGAAAAAVGVDFTELSSVFALLRDNGVSARVASTSLRNILLALAAPTDQARAEIDALGLNVFDAQGNFLGLENAIAEFARTTQGLSQEETARIATTIFGRGGAPAILAGINSVENGVIDLYQRAQSEADGFLDKSLEARQQALSAQTELLTGNIQALLSELGGAISPALLEIVKTLRESISALVEEGLFTDLENSAENFAKALRENPEIIEEITNAIRQTVLFVAELLESLLDVGATLAETESSTKFIGGLNELIANLIQTIDDLVGGIQLAIAIIDPFIKSSLSGFELVLQTVRFLRDAIDEVIERVGALGDRIANVPVLGRVLSGSALGQLLDIRAEAQGLQDDLEGISDAASAESQASTDAFLDNVARREQGQAQAVSDIPASSGTRPTAGDTYQQDLAELENALSEREAVLRESGASQEEIQAELLQIEREGLQDRLTLNREFLGQLQQELDAATDPEKQKEIQEQILDIEQRISSDRIALANTVAEQQQAANERALEDVERAAEQANRAIEASQQDRTIAIREQQNAGILSEEEAASQIEAIARDTANAQIAEYQRQLGEIASLRDQGVISAEEAADREADLQGQIRDATLQRLEDEIQAREEAAERAKQAAIEAIEEELTVFETAQSERIAILDRQTAVLSNQNGLLEARRGLFDALNNLANQALQYEIDRAEAQGRTADAAAFRLELAEQEREQLIAGFEAENQALAIQQRQNALALEREAIEARIAEARARSAIQQAIANGESEAQIDLLRQELAAAEQLSGVIREQQAVQAQVNDIDRQAQLATQAGQLQSSLVDEANQLRQMGREGGLSRDMRDRLVAIDNQLRGNGSAINQIPAFASPALMQPQLNAIEPARVDLGNLPSLVEQIVNFLPQMDRQMVNNITLQGSEANPAEVAAELERQKARQGRRC